MLKIVGDINYTDSYFDVGFGVGSEILHGADPFQYIHRKEDDFWIGNFECVCSETTNKRGVFGKQFRISRQYLEQIQHLNAYSVANNHVMQHGRDAYIQMLHNIECFKASYVGDINRKTIFFEHQNKKVSITSFSLRQDEFNTEPLYWCNPEYCDIERELNTFLLDVDVKIAYIHWGIENINYPNDNQKKLAHWLIDIGFDLVIGLHPHVLQGYEFYREKYIFYSLGNFVFNMPWEPTKYSVIINIDLSDKKPIVSYDYIYINNYFPRIIDEKMVPKQYTFKYLNELLLRNQNMEDYCSVYSFNLKKYRSANRRMIIFNLYKFQFEDIFSIIKDFIKRGLGK
ncbi:MULTISPECIES: CapA family protein [Butyricimonas]|uniref:CapA family protein n=1 Tax=Butyricimonas TaxID=574697 RepID=UPI0022E49065|nr:MULTISPECIES: CapA family protein [Butyricimonas]